VRLIVCPDNYGAAAACFEGGEMTAVG